MTAIHTLVALAICCTVLHGDELRDEAFSTRPCPLLTARIDRWIAELGTTADAEQRSLLRQRLERFPTLAVERITPVLQKTAETLSTGSASEDPAVTAQQNRWLNDLLSVLGHIDVAGTHTILAQIASDTRLTATPRRKAIEALAHLKQPEVLEPLAQLLDDHIVGDDAARAILTIEHFAAVPLWIRLLEHGSRPLRSAAHQRLRDATQETIEADVALWTRYFRDYPEGFHKLPGYRER
jgi:hypothetical protein